MDDLARDYVAMGITEAEDVGECKKCGASVLPWFLGCEACGDPSPLREPDPERWTCNWCGTDSERDAEECCMVLEDAEELVVPAGGSGTEHDRVIIVLNRGEAQAWFQWVEDAVADEDDDAEGRKLRDALDVARQYVGDARVEILNELQGVTSRAACDIFHDTAPEGIARLAEVFSYESRDNAHVYNSRLWDAIGEEIANAEIGQLLL